MLSGIWTLDPLTWVVGDGSWIVDTVCEASDFFAKKEWEGRRETEGEWKGDPSAVLCCALCSVLCICRVQGALPCPALLLFASSLPFSLLPSPFFLLHQYAELQLLEAIKIHH